MGTRHREQAQENQASIREPNRVSRTEEATSKWIRLPTGSDLTSAKHLAGCGNEAEAMELSIETDRFFELRTSSQENWAVPPKSGGGDPERRLLSQECTDQLQQAISALSAAQKPVVTLREINKANQRVLLHHSRSKIRNVMEGCFQTN